MGSVRTKQLGAWTDREPLSHAVSGTGRLWGSFLVSLSFFFNVDSTDPPLTVVGMSEQANSEPTGPWCHIKYQEIHSAVKSTF